MKIKPVQWLLCLLVWLFLLSNHAARAETFNVTAGGSTASCAANPMELQTALDCASAGDTVSVADGVYTALYQINTACTGANPCFLTGATPHGAIIRGSFSNPAENCGGDTQGGDEVGLRVNQEGWRISGLKIEGHFIGIHVSTSANDVNDRTLISENIITDWYCDGVDNLADGVDTVGNVIGHSRDDSTRDPEAGIRYRGDVADPVNDGNITGNWIYSVTDDQDDDMQESRGYSVLLHKHVTNVTVNKNVFLGAMKSGVRAQDDTGETGPFTGIVIEDNICSHMDGICFGSHGDGVEGMILRNNLVMPPTAGAVFEFKGNPVGNNVIHNNTAIRDEAQRAGIMIAEDHGDRSPNTELRDNVFQSDFANNGTSNFFWNIDTTSITLPATGTVGGDFNFWHRPGNNSTWGDFDGFNQNPNTFAYGPNDINDGTRPVFVSESTGNFELQDGTPGTTGNQPASTGGKRGITFNLNLRADLAAAIAAFPVQIDASVTGTSRNFTVTSGHTYQVWGHIPTSASAGDMGLVIEGKSIARNITELESDSSFSHVTLNADPHRLINLGDQIVTDGTLNISWGTSGDIDELRVYQFPTPEGAFTILSGTPPVVGLSPDPDPNPFVTETCDGTGNVPNPPWKNQLGNATPAFRNNGVCGFPSSGVMLHDTTFQDGNVCFTHNTVQGSDLRLLGRCVTTGNDLDCYGIRHIVDSNTTHLVTRTYDITTGSSTEVLISSTIGRVATVNETLCLIVSGDQVCASTDNATPGFSFINFSGSGNGCVTDSTITAAGTWGVTRRDNRDLDNIQLADFGAAPPVVVSDRRRVLQSRRHQ